MAETDLGIGPGQGLEVGRRRLAKEDTCPSQAASIEAATTVPDSWGRRLSW